MVGKNNNNKSNIVDTIRLLTLLLRSDLFGGNECVKEMDDADSELEIGHELVYDTL